MQHSKATVDLLRTAQDALARSGGLLRCAVLCCAVLQCAVLCQALLCCAALWQAEPG